MTKKPLQLQAKVDNQHFHRCSHLIRCDGGSKELAAASMILARPDLVDLAHEDCVQFLLSPDRFLLSNSPGISYLHTSSKYVPYRYDLWNNQSLCRLF